MDSDTTLALVQFVNGGLVIYIITMLFLAFFDGALRKENPPMHEEGLPYPEICCDGCCTFFDRDQLDFPEGLEGLYCHECQGLLRTGDIAPVGHIDGNLLKPTFIISE